jgi:hypothetical protein
VLYVKQGDLWYLLLEFLTCQGFTCNKRISNWISGKNGLAMCSWMKSVHCCVYFPKDKAAF